MSVQEVRSASARTVVAGERTRILVLAGLIVGGIALYVIFRPVDDVTNGTKNLLPYQVLVRTLPESDQNIFRAIRQGLLAAESERARLARWPEPSILALSGVAPFSDEQRFHWQRFSQGVTINYLASPTDPSALAWMLTIQEPEPNAPPDPAPNDDEHHRLPDGTTLHIYVWMHRYGGNVTPDFVAQPQASGWTQVFSVPPNPLFPVRPL
jgi:hypothetical protein